MADKLSIIQDCCIATGNDIPTGEDGSDSWTVASNAYDRYLPLILSKVNWKFITAIMALPRTGTSIFPGYTDMFAPPANCLHLMNVWDTAIAAAAWPSTWSRDPPRAPPLNYKLIGGLVHCSGPNGVTAEYVQMPVNEAAWPQGFLETLRLMIEGALQSGLNEEFEAGVAMKKMAERELADARTRDTQQESRIVPFKSRLRAARARSREGWGSVW